MDRANRWITIKEFRKVTNSKFSEREIRRFCESGVIPAQKFTRVEEGMLYIWMIDTWQIFSSLEKYKQDSEEEKQPSYYDNQIDEFEDGLTITSNISMAYDLDYWVNRYFGDE